MPMSLERKLLTLFSALFVLLATASMVLVCERLLEAFWQAFKFGGYATAGVITLNSRTAALFAIFSVLLIMAGFFLRRLANKYAVRNAELLAGGCGLDCKRKPWDLCRFISESVELVGIGGLRCR